VTQQQLSILEALRHLDPADDGHWTADGMPLVECVAALCLRPLKRSEITQVAPTFNRSTAEAYFAFEAPAKRTVLADDPDHAPEAAEEGGYFERDLATEAAAEAVSGATAHDLALDDRDEMTGTGAPAEAQAAADAGKDRVDDALRAALAAPVADDASVLDLPVLRILSSYELTERAIAEMDQKVRATAKRIEAEKEELRRLNTQADVLAAHRERMVKADPNRSTRDIQAYLASCSAAREQRAARARAFIESGVNARDVADQLRSGAKIDQAMARRSGYGNKRPQVPLRASGAGAQAKG
jgi:hypothetical protein